MTITRVDDQLIVTFDPSTVQAHDADPGGFADLLRFTLRNFEQGVAREQAKVREENYAKLPPADKTRVDDILEGKAVVVEEPNVL